MKFRNFFLGLLVSCAGLIGTQAALAQVSNVNIKQFAASGDGCPPGSYDYILSSDKTTLQILFSQFIAELAPAGELVSFPPTRGCTISVELNLPPGISVSWYRTEHRGFADTTGGARGQFRARYYLPGEGGFDTFKTYSFNPGQAGSYTVVNDNIGAGWTRCGGTQLMSINTRVRLDGRPHGYNTLSVEDETNRVETLLRLRYRSCT